MLKQVSKVEENKLRRRLAKIGHSLNKSGCRELGYSIINQKLWRLVLQNKDFECALKVTDALEKEMA